LTASILLWMVTAIAAPLLKKPQPDDQCRFLVLAAGTFTGALGP